jgi:hypothetical protein
MDEPGFVLPVGVDIRPHFSHNWIIPFSPLPVPVAILGAADFDVREIDVETLRFGPDEATPVFDLTKRLVFRLNHRDINNDGHKDLVSHYKQAMRAMRVVQARSGAGMSGSRARTSPTAVWNPTGSDGVASPVRPAARAARISARVVPSALTAA